MRLAVIVGGFGVAGLGSVVLVGPQCCLLVWAAAWLQSTLAVSSCVEGDWAGKCRGLMQSLQGLPQAVLPLRAVFSLLCTH